MSSDVIMSPDDLRWHKIGSAEIPLSEYKTRWVECPRHGYEVVETWLPRWEMWKSSGDCCPACRLEKSSGRPQPPRGVTMEQFRLSNTGIPERFLGITLKDFTGKAFREPLEVAAKFKPQDNLLVTGKLGSGKTAFVSALLTQPRFLELEPEPRYTSALSVMEQLSQCWYSGEFHGSFLEEINSFREPSILVLDDVEEAIQAEQERDWLERILLVRRREPRRGIVLVGTSLESLEATLGSELLGKCRAWTTLKFGDDL